MIKFFLAREFPTFETTAKEFKRIEEQGDEFRDFLWGETGLEKLLSNIDFKTYESEIDLVLFEFYLNPLPQQLAEYEKKLIDYRKRENAIGVKVFITTDNFFAKSIEERYSFIKEIFLQRLDLLVEVVNKKKLNLNVDLLKADLQKVLEEI